MSKASKKPTNPIGTTDRTAIMTTGLARFDGRTERVVFFEDRVWRAVPGYSVNVSRLTKP